MIVLETRYVQVIINKSHINLDRPFDYKIPDRFYGKIQIGQRIIVPFGRGNNTVDAFIISVSQTCQLADCRLKEIKHIVDERPLLSESQIKLALWMKNYYCCLYIEALQLMIPAGLNLEKREIIHFNGEKAGDIEFRQGMDRNLLQVIQKGKKLSYETIKEKFPYSSLNKSIKRLEKDGFISIEESFYTRVKDKKVKYISLSGKYRRKEEYLEEIQKGAYRQREIINKLNFFPVNYYKFKKEYGFSKESLDRLLEKGLINITSKIQLRNPYNESYKYPPLSLTKEQEIILKDYEESSKGESQKILIHGVTGSGKTEIYLNMIDIMLRRGKRTILLVPEISLTTQMVERVLGRFGDQVSILHSGLSLGERYDQWKRIISGEINIVIGARSALFAPIDDLGLIIIDEEHETTYKSSNRPRYHAREVAEKICELKDCHLVLGSATPSLESYYKAMVNEYKLYTIENRVQNIPMPIIRLIDMREELQKGNYSILSDDLRKEIRLRLEKGEQVILFLNRRGYSTFISCRQCGYVEKCPNCDVSLTYHIHNNRLTCHYCGFTKKAPRICPSCKDKKIKYFGHGTQKVEDIINRVFPEARILRMDMDATKGKGAHDKIINAFKNKGADILVGTQMIAKGLDFPNVTLVGVIIADTSLNLPDFRAAERTFQLITQVAGRAGRGCIRGTVLVQTYEPSHYSLLYASKHDFKGFYREEITLREEMNYPPFCNMINIIFSGDGEEQLIKKAKDFYYRLVELLKKDKKVTLIRNIYRPVPCPISKINNKYRWHMLIKANDMQLLYYKNYLWKIFQNISTKNNDINIAIDINPVSTL